MFDSERKALKRNSILKNNKHSSNDKQLSTGLGFSVKFRQPKPEEEQLSSEKKIQPISKYNVSQPYNKEYFIKDVSNINNLYSHILMMISTRKQDQNNGKTYQIIKMANQIERIIKENIQLKANIDQKYKCMTNLHDLSQYLNANTQDMKDGGLTAFIRNYSEKQAQLQLLEVKIRQLELNASKSKKYHNKQSIRQKQLKIKMLSKKIENQKVDIAKFQEKKKALLKSLYFTQKQILKHDKSSSALKIMIKQKEGDGQCQKIRSKTRQIPGKQNRNDKENIFTSNRQKKNIKIQNLQKVKSSISLAKHLKRLQY